MTKKIRTFFKWLRSRPDAFLNWHGGRRALIVWIVVFTLVTGFIVIKVANLGEDNQKAIDGLAANQVILAKQQEQLAAQAVTIQDLQKIVTELRRTQDDSCTNYRVLRDAVNLFHTTLDGFLKTAQVAREKSYRRTGARGDKIAANIYRQLRAGIRQVKRDCAQHSANTGP